MGPENLNPLFLLRLPSAAAVSREPSAVSCGSGFDGQGRGAVATVD